MQIKYNYKNIAMHFPRANATSHANTDAIAPGFCFLSYKINEGFQNDRVLDELFDDIDVQFDRSIQKLPFIVINCFPIVFYGNL
jgi:hypothetical protein